MEYVPRISFRIDNGPFKVSLVNHHFDSWCHLLLFSYGYFDFIEFCIKDVMQKNYLIYKVFQYEVSFILLDMECISLEKLNQTRGLFFGYQMFCAD